MSELVASRVSTPSTPGTPGTPAKPAERRLTPVEPAQPGRHLAEVRWALPRDVALLGPVPGSGLAMTPYLVRRGDGQVIQVSELVHVVLSRVDPGRTLAQIARSVSLVHGRTLTDDGLDYLLRTKLMPLGLVIDVGAEPAGSDEDRSVARPVLSLGLRGTLIPAPVVRSLARILAPAFHPAVVVAALAALVALDARLLLDGGVMSALSSVLATPTLLLALVGIMTLGAVIHELGHAAGCAASGGTPGRIGFGVYLLFPAFFTNVTDSYRLDRRGRLRTDLGGLYFNVWCLLVAGTLQAWTDSGLLLLVILLMQIEMIQQLIPTVRFDGYFVLTDLTGIPDLFSRIKPVLRSLVPGRPVDPRVQEMRPSARRAVTAWVFTVVPLLGIALVWTIVNLPTIVTTTLGAVKVQWGAVVSGWEATSVQTVLVGTIGTFLLVLPLAGLALFFYRIVVLLVGVVLRRLTADRRRKRMSTIDNPPAAVPARPDGEDEQPAQTGAAPVHAPAPAPVHAPAPAPVHAPTMPADRAEPMAPLAAAVAPRAATPTAEPMTPPSEPVATPIETLTPHAENAVPPAEAMARREASPAALTPAVPEEQAAPEAPAAPEEPAAREEPAAPRGASASSAVDWAGPLTADEFTDESLFGPAHVVAQSGWRKAVRVATGGRVAPGPGAEERRRAEIGQRVRTPIDGSRRIVVMSRKGGVGKTTVTVGLGATFAQSRGDRVVAVDANPDAGNLARRIAGDCPRTITDLLADMDSIDTFSHMRRYTSQCDESRLEVLASDDDAMISQALDRPAYRRVVSLLDHYYNLILLDTGTGILDSANQGLLGEADQLVLVLRPALDGARAGAQTLDWLDHHGYADLVSSAVVVINAVAHSDDQTISAVKQHFVRRCAHVTEIPWDPALESGGRTLLSRLSPSTQEAFIDVAAAVADRFATAGS
jgi:putative peptide zinc metalloprotease protein